MPQQLGRDRVDHARHVVENREGLPARVAIPLLAGEPAVSRRTPAGIRAATRPRLNERLHLRLWNPGIQFDGQPVWIGQVSRDIGVRFTVRTWNLTTHQIDPDVDEARDYG